MKDRRKKGRQALKPLPPEAEARLAVQVARVGELLAAGKAPDEVRTEVATDPQDVLWDLHLIAALAEIRDEGVPALLAALFGPSPDKERRKAIKRALHVLRTRGVAVAGDLLPREEPPPRVGARAVVQAYVSAIFGKGQRYVILEGPKELLGGGNFLVALLSDTAGLEECHLLSVRRKYREELWSHFREQGLQDFPEVPGAYALRLLEDAYELDPDSEPAVSYARQRRALWQVWGPPRERADPEDLLPALSDAERRTYLERSRELAATRLFMSWLPSPEEISPWVDKVLEVENSPLILTELQQQARYEQLTEDAARSLFPPENRNLWRHRLLHMAYFLDVLGRQEEARAAQAAAEDLTAGSPGPLRGENPFLLGLVMYAVRLGLEHRRQTAAKTSSDLATPGGEPLIIGPR